MNKTGIEYLDYTWSPIAMRCTPVSEACAHCWHLELADRFAKNPNFPPEVRAAYAGEGPPVLIGKRLKEPLHKRGSFRIGVQFMGDLWHPDIPLEFQAAVFRIVHQCPQHKFMFLTKRTDILSMFDHACGFPTDPNILLGVTVENQARADERIPILLQIPAAKRFVSVEPDLGPVDLTRIQIGLSYPNGGSDPEPYTINALQDTYVFGDEGDCAFGKLDWVISGGESGKHARPSHPDWFRSLRDQCKTSHTAYLMKQWGEWIPYEFSHYAGLCGEWIAQNGDHQRMLTVDGPNAYQWSAEVVSRRVGKKVSGRLLDGELWDQYPD